MRQAVGTCINLLRIQKMPSPRKATGVFLRRGRRFRSLGGRSDSGLQRAARGQFPGAAMSHPICPVEPIDMMIDQSMYVLKAVIQLCLEQEKARHGEASLVSIPNIQTSFPSCCGTAKLQMLLRTLADRVEPMMTE
jgi:hypothetical protein